jgi:O-antigen ligase
VNRAPEIARRAERFDEVERADPVMASIHLAAACGWMAALTIARAPEGIAFGILAAVAVARLPRTARLYPALFACGAFVLLVGFAEWQGLSTLWSRAARLGANDFVPRFAFVPLLLWPVMNRWRVLLTAFVSAATVHGILVAVVYLARFGGTPGAGSGVFTSDIGVTGLTLAIAVPALGGRPIVAGWVGWATRISAAGACVTGITMLGQRMPPMAAMAGAAAAFGRGVRGPRRAWRLPLAAFVGGTAIAVAMLVASPRNRGWISDVSGLLSGRAQEATTDAMFLASSARVPLARVAIDVWQDHPMIGSGSRGFAMENASRVATDPAAYGVPGPYAQAFSSLTCAHNAFLDEAAERGIIGVVLLAALMAACWRDAWRNDPWSGTAGMMATWTVACLTQSMTVRGVPMMLLAVIVTRVCAVERET